ncbi:MAG: hypothetical protein JJU19_01140 [Pararhodobacter sp.]|nr:hypothetical protein [Pararhodobacter sp.]
MESRTTRTRVTFSKAFALGGSDDLLPAGGYDLIVEEERLQGLTFDAWRRVSAFLEVRPNPHAPGRTELRPVTDAELQQARTHDPARDTGTRLHSDADKVPRKERP